MNITVEDYEVIDRLSVDRSWRQRFGSLAYQNEQVEEARMEVVFALDAMRAGQPARGNE